MLFNEADASEFITTNENDSEWECEECGALQPADVDECPCDYDDDDYDGQPDEYTEWQDYMGGDDWDHGQYDSEW